MSTKKWTKWRVKEKTESAGREKKQVRSEKKEMEVCEEEWRREKGSGIGKSREEGGTNQESAVRKREGDRERGGKSGRENRAGGVNRRGKYTGSFLPRIVSPRLSGAFSSLEKLSFRLYLSFSVFFFFFSSLHPPVFSFLSALSVLSFITLLPSIYLILSVPISALLSMASTLCFPPPVLFSLYSPRMHLFKSCFTKTVLKQREGAGSHARGQLFSENRLLLLSVHVLFLKEERWQTTAGCFQ